MVAADPMIWAIKRLDDWTRVNVGGLTPNKELFGDQDQNSRERWSRFYDDAVSVLADAYMTSSEIEEYMNTLKKLHRMLNDGSLDEYRKLLGDRLADEELIPEEVKQLSSSFTSPQWALDELSSWLAENQLTAESLADSKVWLRFIHYITRKVLHGREITPQEWFDHRESMALLDQAREAGTLGSHLPAIEERHSEVLEEAHKLINPTTLLGKYKAAIRLQKYEEAGELWKQMSDAEREQARRLASHRCAIRKFAFNDMLGKGWDSGKQYSYCMQRSLAGDPQFWWVPEVIRKFPVPPPNWEAVSREPDGRFKEFPGRGKGKKKKEKKSSARAELCRFALSLYFKQHSEEGRRILSLLREIK